jgi:hypothetical protein
VLTVAGGWKGDKQLYADHPEHPVRGHRFDGYYFTYPGEDGHRGVVSTIADDPPLLNWIFVDAATRAVRFGSRKDSVGHVVGPWGWSGDERLLALHGSPEGFILVRERAAPPPPPPAGAEQAAAAAAAGEGREEGEQASSVTEVVGAVRPPLRWALYWDPDEELRRRRKGKDWRVVRLRRRMKLGMDSRYVRANE